MMGMRIMHGLVLAVALLLLAPAAVCAQTAPTAPSAVGANELVYAGTAVQTQVDVNGAAAVALLGSALDRVVAAAQEEGKAQAAGTSKLPIPPHAMAALPMLGPVRDVMKSVNHITVLVMNVPKPVPAAQFLRHYGTILTPRGWTSLLTVLDKSGPAVSAMVGPEGKGLFIAVNDKKQMIVGLLTTDRPIGDMLGEVVQAATAAAPDLVTAMMRGKQGAPPPAKAVAPPAPEPPEAPDAPATPPAPPAPE